MQIKKTKYNINTQLDTLILMKDVCIKYYTDCNNINFFSQTDFEKIYYYLQRRYKIEKGEILQRPRVTDELQCCDCDCQTIYVTCCALCNSKFISKIIWVVCGTKGYTHIFPVLVTNVNRNIFTWYFDMLPDRDFDFRYGYKYIKSYAFDLI